MVLESIIGEKNIRQKPVLIMILTFLISSGSIFFATQLFPSSASILSIAFITIGLVPIVHNILSKEEYAEALDRKSSATFFARHFNLIQIYVWIFVGVILAFSMTYVFSPVEMKQTLFDEQIASFCAITGGENCESGVPFSISGRAALTASEACKNPNTSSVSSCAFFILENNGGVLFFIIILSLLYGAGAIFIIAWNASILGIFFGEMILASQHLKWFGFLQGMLIGHGPPELLAYIFGALAGAMLSAMISRSQYLKHEFSTIMKDIIFLIFLAFFSVIYGSIVEAIGIIGYVDLYYLLGFIYVLVLLLIVVFYGKKFRLNF